MSGAEQEVEAAIMSVIVGDPDVRGILGYPVRVRKEAGDRPAWPYMEIARHVSEPANSLAYEAEEHRIDIAVMSLGKGGTDGFAAIAAMRAALNRTELSMDGWRCILLAPLFSDSLAAGVGRWRAMLRLRVLVEPDA